MTADQAEAPTGTPHFAYIDRRRRSGAFEGLMFR